MLQMLVVGTYLESMRQVGIVRTIHRPIQHEGVPKGKGILYQLWEVSSNMVEEGVPSVLGVLLEYIG